MELTDHGPETHHTLLALAQWVVVEGPFDLLPGTQITVVALKGNKVCIGLADIGQGGTGPL